MVTIHVTNANGRTCEVHISWKSMLQTYSRGLTDKNGYVSFDVTGGGGTVSVDGKVVYSGNVSGTISVSKQE
jgi:hypothetical protein